MTHRRYALVKVIVGLILFTSSVKADYMEMTYTDNDHDPGRFSVQDMRDAVAGTDAIYGLADSDGVVRLPYDGSKPSESKFGEAVYGLTVNKDGQPCVLFEEVFSLNLFVACRLGPEKSYPEEQDPATAWWLSPPTMLYLKKIPKSKLYEDEEPMGLAADGNRLFVITTDRILFINKNEKTWKTIKLKSKLTYFGAERYQTVIRQGKVLWYGEDDGEFGGRLTRINLLDGDVHPVKDIGDVTGIVPGNDEDDCVVVSSGLAHLFQSDGALFRICDGEPESIYKGDMPIWGLYKSGSGLYALMQTGVVPIVSGKFQYELEHKFKNMELKTLFDIPVAQYQGMLFVYSGARGSNSTGGNGTPFVFTPPNDTQISFNPDRIPYQ